MSGLRAGRLMSARVANYLCNMEGKRPQLCYGVSVKLE
jgi:hypothetical protein